MVRRAYVIVASWPLEVMTDVGRVTWCCTGGTEAHIGIFIPCCTDEEVKAHSDPAVTDPTAVDQKHVTFDYMIDGHPRFQSTTNPHYWTKSSSIWCYPILDVEAADVHAACLEIAYLRPYNHPCYRLNGACGGCWPCHTWSSNTPRVGPSTCVSLTMRIIARVRSGSQRPYVSDEATFRELEIPRCGLDNPCAAGTLTSFSPRAALEALQRASVVGRPLEGFARAISLCSGGAVTAPLGCLAPKLLEMSRVHNLGERGVLRKFL